MQVKTERGLISVKKTYISGEKAKEAGFTYAFNDNGTDYYSKCLDDKGLSRAFARIINKETIIELAEDSGWNVEVNGNTFEFRQSSPCNQDFGFCAEMENDDVETLIDAIYEAYNDYDASAENYLWPDNEGHGKNGAPYDMKEVYEDMEACQKMMLELHDLFYEKFIERKKKEAAEYDMSELARCSELYHYICIKEYIEEQNPSWPKDKVEFVARRARALFEKIERGDEEAECIAIAVKEWGERNA